MLIFIVTIASLNLALGAGVAVVVSHEWNDLRLLFKGLQFRRSRSPVIAVRHVPAETIALPVETSSLEREQVRPLLPLPQGWYERLTAHHVDPSSVWEAVLHLVRMDGEVHRARWIAAEQSLRAALQQSGTSAHQSFKPLRSEVSAWLDWAQAFLSDFSECKKNLGDVSAGGDQLEELLLDQIACIEALRLQHDELAHDSGSELTGRRFIKECATIFEKSFVLRDFVLEQLSGLAVGEQRVVDLPPAWQRDAVTGYPNRLGMETVLVDWSEADPSRKRLVCGAYIEIDRLGKLNERLGVQQSDQVIRAFAKIVEGVVRSDRGDRVARVSGPTFFVLLTDTGVAGGKAAAERIRQTIEAATFAARSEEFTLAANCAVCEYMFEDTAIDVMARLQAGIVEAKRGGRNRTAIDEGQGPVLFDAQPIQVRAQTIPV